MRWVSGIKNLHDFNCGLKAYRKDVVKNIEVYGEMHRYIPVTDSPYFYLSLTMMIIGTQLFLAGFIGDLISRSSSTRNDYQIEETLRCEE